MGYIYLHMCMCACVLLYCAKGDCKFGKPDTLGAERGRLCRHFTLSFASSPLYFMSFYKHFFAFVSSLLLSVFCVL